MSLFSNLDGHYDDKGRWKATKHCLVSCGVRCTCRPPFGQYQLPAEEMNRRADEKYHAKRLLREGTPTNPEEML